MRASRLLAILIILKDKGRITARSLADRFEVSTRTIYRDLDELSAAGVPIITDRGVGGGIALSGPYKNDFSALTPGEAAAFSLAVLPELAGHLGLAGEAAGAKAKLMDSLGEKAAFVASRIIVDPASWYSELKLPDCLHVITAAVLENKVLSFQYTSWKRTAVHTVEPLGLIVKSGKWYLLARNKRGKLVFRADMISDVSLTGEVFRLPAEFDLATEWRARTASFEQGLFSEEATVIVKPAAIEHLGRLGDRAANRILETPADHQGHRHVIIAVESGDGFAREVLWFAGDIIVVEPPTLVRKIRRLHEAASQATGQSANAPARRSGGK